MTACIGSPEGRTPSRYIRSPDRWISSGENFGESVCPEAADGIPGMKTRTAHVTAALIQI
jgi:hypothetical protein